MNAAGASHTQDRHHTMPAPPSPKTPQPRRLLSHHDEVPLLIPPGFHLNRERDTVRPDRHGIDVPTPGPAQRMPHLPAFRHELPQRAAPRPPTERPRDYGQRDPANGVPEMREPPRRASTAPPPTQGRRSRPPPLAAPRRRRLTPPLPHASTAGTAGGGDSSIAT